MLGGDEELALRAQLRAARDDGGADGDAAPLLEVVRQREHLARLRVEPRLLPRRRPLAERAPVVSRLVLLRRSVGREGGGRVRRADRGGGGEEAEQLRPPRLWRLPRAVGVLQRHVLPDGVQGLQRDRVEEAGGGGAGTELVVAGGRRDDEAKEDDRHQHERRQLEGQHVERDHAERGARAGGRRERERLWVWESRPPPGGAQRGEQAAADVHREVHLQEEHRRDKGDHLEPAKPREGDGEQEREGGGALRLRVPTRQQVQPERLGAWHVAARGDGAEDGRSDVEAGDARADPDLISEDLG